MAADDLVDDWALALPSATIMERIAKPDISRHHAGVSWAFLQIETCLSFKRHLSVTLCRAADGSRSPKLDCRQMFESFLREIDLAGMITAAVSEALRANALQW